jgi:hypothetical protein
MQGQPNGSVEAVVGPLRSGANNADTIAAFPWCGYIQGRQDAFEARVLLCTLMLR